jgi:hypothetical protein
MKSLMKSAPASIVGYVVLVVILTAGAAQSLTGTNTVDSGDIIDGTINTRDLKAGSIAGSRLLNNGITGSKILNDSLTGADINESTFVLTCPAAAPSALGGLCYSAAHDADPWSTARTTCASAHLDLPSVSQAMNINTAESTNTSLWTNELDGGGTFLVANASSFDSDANTNPHAYRCVTTVGARP